MEASARELSEDLRLAGAVAGGSLVDWHAFVLRYSRQILDVIHRTLRDSDEDERRGAYVETLAHFYATGLADYDGRAPLGAWVVTVAASRCVDLRRARRGRYRDPAWLSQLPARDQTVYRLHFLQFVPPEQIRDRFAASGEPLPAAELDAILDRLYGRMGRHVRTTLAYRAQARTIGGTSVRMLQLLDGLRIEAEDRQQTLRPDYVLFESRTRELLAQIDDCVRRLDDQQEAVIRLRFYDKLSARQIAQRLNITGPRAVYTLVDQAIRRLRQLLSDPDRARGARQDRRGRDKDKKETM